MYKKCYNLDRWNFNSFRLIYFAHKVYVIWQKLNMIWMEYAVYYILIWVQIIYTFTPNSVWCSRMVMQRMGSPQNYFNNFTHFGCFIAICWSHWVDVPIHQLGFFEYKFIHYIKFNFHENSYIRYFQKMSCRFQNENTFK